MIVGDPSLVHACPSVAALLVWEICGQSNERHEKATMQRVPRPAGVSRPIGKWPDAWADYTHEFDGHGLDANPESREGEKTLSKEFQSLYVRHGIEEAVDDVSNAYIDPSLVKDARNVDMFLLRI